MLDNKTLRPKVSCDLYCIIALHDGVRKYVSTDFVRRYGFDYTVKLSKAMFFQTSDRAEEFIDQNLTGVPAEIHRVIKSLKLVD